MMKDNLIKDLSFVFAKKIIAVCRELQEQKEFILSKQLLRSGTSIGANVEEALAGYSQRDFLFKMTTASKEARETKYWLRLINESAFLNYDLTNLLDEVNDLINILAKIVITTTQRMGHTNAEGL